MCLIIGASIRCAFPNSLILSDNNNAMNYTISTVLLLALVANACNGQAKKSASERPGKTAQTVKTAIGDLTLPAPYATASTTKRSRMVDWNGHKPIAPKGFKVTKFAEDFERCRWIYQAPNLDIFVSDSFADQIVVFRDKDKDGHYETRETFLKNLNRPFGILVLDNHFYVANTNGLYRYPYQNELKLTAKGQKILDLPAGGYNNHWTRNLLAAKDGSKIYVTVGSGSNVGENGMQHEMRRACILEINPDGSGEKLYASGLRNPVGVDWNPVNGELWTAVNERDGLGDDLVPDYITSVQRGGFYGWPYAYFGQIVDPRLEGQRPDLVEQSIVPAVPVGSHTASLSVAFYTKDAFPSGYRNGAFVGQHGSWNRANISGYKVLFVPFKDGKPSGAPQDFLTGFVANADRAEVYGRPVCVMVLHDGSLLVSDDGSNTIWQISAER